MTHEFSPRADAGFKRVRFIMVNPSHPGNIGATARAIKTMGFSELCLVAPQCSNPGAHADAIALASGAADVLQTMQIVETLEQALAPVTMAFALTARARVSGPPPCDIRGAAELGRDHLHQFTAARVAFVLGTERAGLSNEHIALCQRVCHIPANPNYSSLNVSQAAQLVAWEQRYALASAASLPLLPSTHGAIDSGTLPASSASVQAFLDHLETALIATGFLVPAHPKKLMIHMRHLFTRCNLSHDETNMLRGMCKAMIESAEHSGRHM